MKKDDRVYLEHIQDCFSTVVQYLAHVGYPEFLEDEEITYLQLAQQAIESLYNSPVHRKNILNKNYVFGVSGAALEKTKEGFFLLVTQNFYNNWTF